jgi:DNA replication and repair protein RecF
LLVGDNAQGKTTLLEAVYFLATFTSFHASHDRQLINFLAEEENPPFARLVADFQRGGRAHRLEIRLIQDAVGANGGRLRKEILVDGVKRSMQEAMGSFNAVLFLPQMTQILEGGPEERRRYLNLTLSQIVPGYAQALTEYVQVVSQRNALLKQLAERGGDSEQLTYWDVLLVQRGAFLIQARIRALNELERLSSRIHDRLTEGKEVLRLVYRPGYDPAADTRPQYSLPIETPVDRSGFTEEQIREGFLSRLRAARAEEIQRGVTTIGPHRDEVRFTANGIDLGDFGSRGQVRTALMALKLAEVAWMREKIGEWPVLLLDETLAELDLQRRADLLDALGDCDQALLTTTDLKLFNDSFVRQCAVWQVQAGCVQRVDQPV